MGFIKLTLVCVLFMIVFDQSNALNNEFKPFWESLSTIQKKELAKVFGNASLTKAEVLKKLNNIADRSDSKKTKMARDNLMHQLEEYTNNPFQFPPNLSEDAKTVLKQIITPGLDHSRTFKSDCIDGNRIIEKASAAVKAEIPYLNKKQDCEKNVLERFLQKQKS